jgi:membrane-associated phospholipid phosphatase
MYRGMHYPTDTGTSFLLGLALLAIAFLALPLSGGRPDEDRVRRRRRAAVAQSTDEFARTRP